MNRRTAITTTGGLLALPLVRAQATPPGSGATNARDYGAIGDGVADDTAALQAALAAAQASAARCLYIPAGVYRVALTGGILFNCTAPNLTICGDGIGLTTLQLDPTTLTTRLSVIALTHPYQTVRDLSIVWLPGMSGTFDSVGVDVLNGALYWSAQRIECVNAYGTSSAGGLGLGCYQDPAVGGGWQWGCAEDCITRDTPLGCGFGTASNGNAFVRCVALRCGNTGNRHGFYNQGGANRFEQCYVEAAAGFSFHAHKQSQALEASGDLYDGCWSVNPIKAHMIVDSYTPPGGQPLTRYVTIANCTFKGAAEGVELKVPAIITGNVFDGVVKTGSGTLTLSAGADGSQASDNQFIDCGFVNIGGPNMTFHHNTLRGRLTTININGSGARVESNRLLTYGVNGVGGVYAIGCSAANASILNNDVTVTAPGACLKTYPSATGYIARGNVLTAIGGAWYQDVAIPFGGVLDNVLR